MKKELPKHLLDKVTKEDIDAFLDEREDATEEVKQFLSELKVILRTVRGIPSEHNFDVFLFLLWRIWKKL